MNVTLLPVTSLNFAFPIFASAFLSKGLYYNYFLGRINTYKYRARTIYVNEIRNV